jgi:adenine deaminase
VPPTVNSYYPAYFHGYLDENLLAVQGAAPLTRDELLQLSRNAFLVSWAEPADRER